MKYTINLNRDSIIMRISDDQYRKIFTTIKKLRKKYNKAIEKYKNKNFDSLEIMNNKAKLVIEIIENIIKEYKEIDKYRVTVFLVGSYARSTNKKNSDIDIQFAYPKKYQKQVMVYKEIIEYIISIVLDVPKRKIHSAMIEKLDNSLSDKVKKMVSKDDFNIEIKSKIGSIRYSYNQFTKKRIYLTYNNDTSLKRIFKYIKNEIRNDNREWAHVFYPVNNKEKFYKIYDKLYKYEKKLLTDYRIENRKKNIYKLSKKIKEDIKTEQLNNIKNFKRIFQIEEFALLNEYICLKRDLYLKKGSDWRYINYYENFDLLKNDEIFIKILKYMFKLFSIVDRMGNSYSVHRENYLIELKELDDIKIKLLKLNNEIEVACYEK